jgi:hypothetical protein
MLRETSFSGFDSFMEHEEPKSGVGRIVLLLVLLAGLGVAGWWAYTNYVGATEKQKLQAAISNADETPTDKPSPAPQGTPSTKPAAPDAASPDTSSTQTASSPSAPPPVTDSQSQTPESASRTVDSEPKPPATAKHVPPATPKTTPAHKSVAQHEPLVAAARAPSRAEPAAGADTGDAAFRRGEAYLYGRGIRENCDEAVKNLKIASSQSNAKARSTFGTMYATGHCVPRDLPTSYLWFALALRVDPTNQILEKDLNAVWNQMTPPERQQATRMKQ